MTEKQPKTPKSIIPYQHKFHIHPDGVAKRKPRKKTQGSQAVQSQKGEKRGTPSNQAGSCLESGSLGRSEVDLRLDRFNQERAATLPISSGGGFSRPGGSPKFQDLQPLISSLFRPLLSFSVENDRWKEEAGRQLAATALDKDGDDGKFFRDSFLENYSNTSFSELQRLELSYRDEGNFAKFGDWGEKGLLSSHPLSSCFSRSFLDSPCSAEVFCIWILLRDLPRELEELKKLASSLPHAKFIFLDDEVNRRLYLPLYDKAWSERSEQGEMMPHLLLQSSLLPLNYWCDYMGWTADILVEGRCARGNPEDPVFYLSQFDPDVVVYYLFFYFGRRSQFWVRAHLLFFSSSCHRTNLALLTQTRSLDEMLPFSSLSPARQRYIWDQLLAISDFFQDSLTEDWLLNEVVSLSLSSRLDEDKSYLQNLEEMMKFFEGSPTQKALLEGINLNIRATSSLLQKSQP